MAKILVVDGDDSYRRLMEIALRPLVDGGHMVKMSSDVTEGISILNEEHPDLLVTGWVFPDTTSGGLMERALDLKIPVIVNTSIYRGENRRLDGLVESHVGDIHRIQDKSDSKEILETVSALVNKRTTEGGPRSVEY